MEKMNKIVEQQETTSEFFELTSQDEQAIEDFGAQLLWEYNYTTTT